jgi:RimJ/RimL family protein N-acetyltransferase
VSDLPLRGERITIEPLCERDIAEFVAYRREPEVARWQSWTTDFSASDAQTLLTVQQGWQFPPPGQWLQLAVRDLDGHLLGDLALHSLADQPDSYEIGFTLAPAAQGRGYATEAVLVLLRYLFTVRGAHRVIASADARNTASSALLARVGMRAESHQVDADWFKGEWTTLDGFAMLADDYAAAHAADL